MLNFIEFSQLIGIYLYIYKSFTSTKGIIAKTMPMFDLLGDLVPYLSRYQNAEPQSASLRGFSDWLSSTLAQEDRLLEAQQNASQDAPLQNAIAIVRLYRYAKHYAFSDATTCKNGFN
jgi:hypothetical protein